MRSNGSAITPVVMPITVASRDGKLHLTCAPGAGTTLHVTLPLGSAKPGDAGHRRTG
jgi:hypothetical protein